MTRPTISFLLPTHRNDRPVERALRSIVPQLLPGDEVLVIGDTLDGALPEIERICRRYPGVRYLEHNAGHHDWGHSQITYGFTEARGDVLQCSDDDDIWCPDAAEAIRQGVEANPGRPLLYRFLSYWGIVFWEMEGLVLRNHVGGHCLVQPNIPGKIGTMAPEYNGDFDMIRRCLDLHGGDASAVWIDHIVNIARPSALVASQLVPA